MRASAQTLRQRANLARDALVAEQEAVKEVERLEQVREKQPLEVRLTLLIGAAKPAAEVFKEWTDNGERQLDRAEFRRQLRSIGLSVTKQQADDLYEQANERRKPTIALPEFCRYIEKLQASASWHCIAALDVAVITCTVLSLSLSLSLFLSLPPSLVWIHVE